jgi:hypothetical protein
MTPPPTWDSAQVAGTLTASLVLAGDLAAVPAGSSARRRVISDCHFRKTATEYDRKTGIKWLSYTEK